jgi:hypothetical protein
MTSGIDDESYRIGFEDALELCISEKENSKDKEAAWTKIREYLDVIKENKIAHIKEMLLEARH